MRKGIKVMITSLAAAQMLFGCGKEPEQKHNGLRCSASADNVTVEVTDLSLAPMNARDTKITSSVTITNAKEEAVSQVFFTVFFLDEEEAVLDEVKMFYVPDEALEAGTSVTTEIRSISQMKQEPASARLELREVKTVSEVPVEPVPQPGDYLYQIYEDAHLKTIQEQPPVAIEAVIDHMGDQRKTVFTKEDELDTALQYFLQMKLGADNAPMVTDNYNRIRLEWEDGTSTVYPFNLDALEVSANGRYHSYYVLDAEPFWTLVHSRITW